MFLWTNLFEPTYTIGVDVLWNLEKIYSFPTYKFLIFTHITITWPHVSFDERSKVLLQAYPPFLLVFVRLNWTDYLTNKKIACGEKKYITTLKKKKEQQKQILKTHRNLSYDSRVFDELLK